MTRDNRSLLDEFDWASTPLGARESWPPEMHAVLQTVMRSGFPASTAWGPSLIQIYNDAYNAIYGDKHPGSFGQPAADSWPEIRDFLQPALAGVMESAESLWFRDTMLPLAKHGHPEECWFDFSYSPVCNLQGKPIGLISIAVEKTQETVARRRQQLLDLIAELPAGFAPEDLGSCLAQGIAADHPDAAAWSLWQLQDPAQMPAQGICVHRGGPALCAELGQSPESWPSQVTSNELSCADSKDTLSGRAALIPICPRPGRPWALLVLASSPLVPEPSHLQFARQLHDRLCNQLAQDDALRRTQSQLAEQGQLYRYLFENIMDAAIYASTEGDPTSDETIIAANPSACTLLGYSHEELVGMPRDALFFDNDPALHKALVQRGQRREFMGELIMRHRSGKPVAVEVSSRLMHSEDGELRSVNILRDISSRAATELERASRARAEAIGQVAGGIAHDFNNLLTVMLGSLDMLQEEVPEGGRAAELVRNALLCAERGSTLTAQLLAYSRQQMLTLRPTDLDAVLLELSPLLRSSLGETSKLELEQHGALPPVVTDLSQLTTALLNLVINASHAMPEGGCLSLQTALQRVGPEDDALHWPLLADGEYVCLRVIDTGGGIDPLHAARVFDPYFSTKPMGLGSGLGLSMVKGFMQQSGGDIRLASSDSHGTVFELLFATSQRHVPAQSAAPERRLGDKRRILVVEDNDLVRRQVCLMLESAGCSVFSVENGRQALEWLREHARPDLVISDVIMPGGISGVHLVREIRTRYAGLPIILMSGHNPWNEGQAPDEQLELLSKPFTRDSLVGKVMQCLDAGRNAGTDLDARAGTTPQKE